jgi:hypothetical protein
VLLPDFIAGERIIRSKGSLARRNAAILHLR